MLPRFRSPAPTLCGRGQETDASTRGNRRPDVAVAVDEAAAPLDPGDSFDVEATGEPLTFVPFPLTF